MIRLGVFYVPRNAEGDFVKMESNFNKGVVVEPAPFPDIHSTREYHLIKRLARAHSLDLGVTWGAYQRGHLCHRGAGRILRHLSRYFFLGDQCQLPFQCVGPGW